MSAEIESRTKQWYAKEQEMRGMTDALGETIDEGILETVTALNILGINTCQSCEGHLDHRITTPWIDIEAAKTEEIKNLKGEVFSLWDKIADNRFQDEEEKIRDITTFTELATPLKKINYAEVEKLKPLLNQFYHQRERDFDIRLHIAYGRFDARLENQGAEYFEFQPEEVRQQMLLEFQQEMQEFGRFLKNYFFSKNR